MMTGKHVNDELSDAAMHDIALSDSHLSADIGEGEPRATNHYGDTQYVCMNDSVFPVWSLQGAKNPSSHVTETIIFQMDTHAKNHPASS